MHPIIVRPAFLPAEIKSASGNGGGAFIGLMPIVGNPSDTIGNEDDTPTSVEIAQFKREPRTQEEMIDIFRKAKKLGSSARMILLRDSGLHFVKNAFWKINNSSPYDAYSYDFLHAFDAGEWGKHLWPLVLELLKQTDMHPLIQYAPDTIFRDILKLLPPNASLVHCIRISAILRSIAGLRVVSDEQIKAYRQFFTKYEKWCKSTRPGEGFQQEVQQAYSQTNFKNTESQITRIDENQEAIARIRMFVDLNDVEISKAMSAEDLTDGCGPPPESNKKANLPAYRSFGRKLQEFLGKELEEESRPSGFLTITPYQCLYLTYMSLEDWREKRDILRCNPSFYDTPAMIASSSIRTL
ncbi:hypothetical protein M422DRAFT_256168 [Sphaerobolus stellatus SS14]|uniref:Uncharacterized protein n=1 Tax=Sphaerobolus stellatus (strain SS14) TaxID=990650 RepID=A0A0C9VH61_SPHS4|nr:hypothetical protein M422DRAFT_256168 [Sphaerobolus stellatus SS14]